MNIGVPKEVRDNEHRVALTPAAALKLTGAGHRIFVETGAGKGARFEDTAYRDAGAEIVYGRDELFRRVELILAVAGLSQSDLEFIEPNQTIFAFHHMVMAPKEYVQTLVKQNATAIGYELIEDKNGLRPILSAIGELAGKMVVHQAAYLLQAEQGGRGVMLGAVGSAPPAQVLIVGAGTVGRSAARLLIETGANVLLIDSEDERLRQAEKEFSGRLKTDKADPDTVAQYTSIADVVIGAVRIPAERAPHLVTRDMVAGMRPGSVIIDVAIDQGGCVETSRPTTLAQPTFTVNDVLHFCVPNLTANLPRTASKLLSGTHLPYVEEVAKVGVEKALKNIPGLAAGIYLHNGKIELSELAEEMGK